MRPESELRDKVKEIRERRMNLYDNVSLDSEGEPVKDGDKELAQRMKGKEVFAEWMLGERDDL